jgi:hypothetical protein
MSQQELLKKLVKSLENAGIDYMITGSIASSLQGEPRSTHDIDIVISMHLSEVQKIINAFKPPEFFLNEASIREAVKTGKMFNIIEGKQGDKIDFWMLTEEAFDNSRFSRKYAENFEGIELYVSSPEDTILAKLRWAKLSGGSEKQFTDALRVFEIQQGKLDMDYLQHWSGQLNIKELWNDLKSKAEPL